MHKIRYYIWLAFLLLSFNGQSQSPLNYCTEERLLLHALETFHYQPVPIGSQLTERTYKLFLETLDPHGLYFIVSDTAILSSCKTEMIEKNNAHLCEDCFTKISDLYRERLIEADSVISDVLQTPLTFTSNDSIYFGETENINFAKDKKTLRNGWKRWLKYQALLYLFSPDSTNDNPFLRKDSQILKKETEVINKIKIREQRFINRILNSPQGFSNYVASAFLNALAASFDPHSSYFSPSEKQDFESSLSPDAPSYGFEVEDKPNGTVQISRLIPGGPAWKSNELHKGDVLVQVQWPHGEIVDLSYSDKEETDEILQSSESDRMELTVRKPNGQLKTVRLIKKMLKADDNLIKSFVLKGKKNIGYISLPGFYTEWENQDPTGCSVDMAKEILKLKQEHVEGIIIDLRNNGGGAMNEAIALAGTFIEGGPLCILRERDKKLTLLKDMNLGTIYDGPLVLMVNGFSASASEILAASLQDYHRAVIVGSPTFGKASGQSIIPLDTLAWINPKGSTNKHNPGFAKITVSRFYRLNGSSYQGKGVVPDILLPAQVEGWGIRETKQPYAFGGDSVEKKVHFVPFPDLPVRELSDRSRIRLAQDTIFRKIIQISDSLKIALKNLKAVSLNIDSFRKKEAWIFEALQTLDNITERPSLDYRVTNVKYDEALINLSSYRKEINEILIKNLQNDIYIQETYQITNDLINYH
ncbi:MAG TPA: carboxy terminal-processing peptidase [Bacteroidales bacterium]